MSRETPSHPYLQVVFDQVQEIEYFLRTTIQKCIDATVCIGIWSIFMEDGVGGGGGTLHEEMHEDGKVFC